MANMITLFTYIHIMIIWVINQTKSANRSYKHMRKLHVTYF